MLRNHATRMGITAFCLVAGPAVFAQTATTGAINGAVLDNSGAPLAGATVRFISGQINKTVVTGVDGRFTGGLLNAGTWQVAVSKPGYSLSRQNVSVSINSTTTTNFKLAKEGSATVEVIASAAAVDTSSTTTGANFTLDTINAIPKGRDIQDIAFLAPGVSSGGTFTQNGGLGLSFNGASGAENSFSVDGLKTNDMRYGGQGVNMTTEFVDQIDVQTGGFKPEYSALGGVFNVVTKTGSNEFAGTSWVSMAPSALKPGAKKNAFFQEFKPGTTYEAGAWVGGAAVKDKLFYSVGLNYKKTTNPSFPNASGNLIPEITIPDVQFFGKFNYFLNTNHQLTLSFFGDNQTTTTPSAAATPVLIGNGYGTANGGADVTNNSSNVNLIYDGTLAPNVTLSVKYGTSKITNDTKPYDLNTPLVNDALWFVPVAQGGSGHTGAPAGTIYSRGGFGLWTKEKDKTTQGTVDLSWVLGDHSLKFGYSFLTSDYTLVENNTGGERDSLALSGGIPRIRERIITNNSTVKAEFGALYAQDSWQITKDSNVFFGFRAESQDQKDADGKSFLKFKMADYIQPRLGFTWDVMGTGKSKLSGSFAWYYEQIPQRLAIREFSHEVFYENRYVTPAHGTFTYNPNAANNYGTTGGKAQVVDYAASFTNPPIADGIKLPKRTEILLGYEQQVSATVTLGIHGHYRKLKNPIEDSVITDLDGNSPANDSNGPAILWNPGPGPVSWNSSTLPGVKVNVAQTYFPKAFNTYKAVDLTYKYQTSTQMLSATYTWSRLEGNYEGLISSSNGQADGNITASFDYYPYWGTGLLPLDRTHQFKLFGYQKFVVANHDLFVGFNFSASSGVPISYWDDGSTSNPVLPDIGAYGNGTPMNNKLGDHGRTPYVTKLNLNFSYILPLGGKMKLEPQLDIFNLYNSRNVATVNEQATDAGGSPLPVGEYGAAKTWAEGRSVRFSLRLRF